MFCTNCGKEITQRASFCTGCGAPLCWPEEPKSAVAEEEKKPEILNEAPAAPEAPVVPEAPVIPEEPVVPEAPVIPEEPVVPEAPVMQEVPVMQEAPVYEEPAPAYEAPIYQSQPAAPKQKKSGKGGMIALIVVAGVLALCLIGTAIYCALLYRQCDNLADTVEELQEENADLYEQNDALHDELDALYDNYYAIYDEYDFFHEHAVFCSEDNNYYHSYDCPDWDREGFWIFNVEYAEYSEYTPCPYCQ